ncbi:MAG TPA: NAD-dependent epimerase/dehydratase family protein [Actinomycetota bacterium]|nr:NAD-dependent epimerase/dehydratase family protein [Actinomycetota bacterium]
MPSSDTSAPSARRPGGGSRIVLVGATGNVGTSLLRRLEDDPAIASITAVARRPARSTSEKTAWVAADIGQDDLVPRFAGADAVVHLAWAIQPSHDEATMARTNLLGSHRVFEAAAAAGVGAIVYASSVGAYSPGPKDRPVDESWPTDGIATSFYARHKATVERMLDRFEERHPDLRVVRMRPGLIFKRGQGSEGRRLFLGPLVPVRFLHPKLLPLLPDVRGVRFQAVHTEDVAEAYHRAVVGDARGPFNLVADPILDLPTIADAIGARTIPMPASVARAVVELSWRARLQPTPTGWLDMGLRSPILSRARAERELAWTPTRSSTDAVHEVLEGIATRAGEPTPKLEPTIDGHLLERNVGRSDVVR